MKNQRRIGQPLAGFEPMPEIIANVVTAERKHCHGIAPDLPDRSGSCCGSLRRHGRAYISTVFPVERLKDERHGIAPASAENDGADRNAAAVFNMRIEHGIVAHGSGEAAVGMGRFFLGRWCPIVAAPVDRVRWRGAVLAFPPSVAVIDQCYVGINSIALDRFHRVRV